MSEIPTPPQEQTPVQETKHDSTLKHAIDKAFDFLHLHHKEAAVATVAAAIAVPTVVAGGQIAQSEIRQANENEKQANIQETEIAQHEDFVEALNANHPADSVIANISLGQGQNLEGATATVLPQETFAANYDSLHASAKEQGVVQPGEQFAVVDPNKAVEGDAFIIPADQVVHSDITELPTPVIESQPQDQQPNTTP